MVYRVCWTATCPTVYRPCAVDSMPCLLDVVSVLADGTPILIDGIPCAVDRIFLGVGTCSSWRCLISCIAPICRAAPRQGGQGVYSGLCKLCRGDKPRKVQVHVLIARWKQAVMEHGVYSRYPPPHAPPNHQNASRMAPHREMRPRILSCALLRPRKLSNSHVAQTIPGHGNISEGTRRCWRWQGSREAKARNTRGEAGEACSSSGKVSLSGELGHQVSM